MKPLSSLLLLATLGGVCRSATAQTPVPPFKLSCQDSSNWKGDRATRQVCETRELALEVSAGQPLTVDGGTNGSITVRGWDGPNVRVRALVQRWVDIRTTAQNELQVITISSQNQTLRAEGPAANASRKSLYWSVSYEIFVPRQTSLVLHTTNGSISVENVQANVRFDAVNGGVSLSHLGGQVAGRTVNGGLTIQLSGRKWDGAGLDVQSTNGGISWRLPTGYSAQFFTSTNVDEISASNGLPITKRGLLHREISTTLGQGGVLLRAVTKNGSIIVR